MSLLQAPSPDWVDVPIAEESSGEWAHGLSKADAEDLLDWLVDHGVQGEVRCDEGHRFAVRCPGFRVEKNSEQGLRIRHE
jgi:hypothetical protein